MKIIRLVEERSTLLVDDYGKYNVDDDCFIAISKNGEGKLIILYTEPGLDQWFGHYREHDELNADVLNDEIKDTPDVLRTAVIDHAYSVYRFKDTGERERMLSFLKDICEEFNL